MDTLPTAALLGSLSGSVVLLGLAATPHCAAMCAAPCAAAAGPRGRSQVAFHAARIGGYAVAGAAAAAVVGAGEQLAAWSSGLKPVWTLVQVAVFVWGGWMLATGRLPRRVIGQVGWQPLTRWQGKPHTTLGTAGTAGALWWAWPCGVLHSAWVLAALSGNPLGGAAVMAGFAAASAPGLLLGPWAWRRWQARRGARVVSEALAQRVAGAALMVASGFGLLHGVWLPLMKACGWA
jgi:uncharacterized protein